jgi:hypothetical protein
MELITISDTQGRFIWSLFFRKDHAETVSTLKINIKRKSHVATTHAKERFTKRDIDNTNPMPTQTIAAVREFVTPVTSS